MKAKYFLLFALVGCGNSPITYSAPAPAPEGVIVAMKGGEKLLDGANGNFAWVATDDAVFAYDSATAIVRQLNQPTEGSNQSFVFYDHVSSLAVNQDGRVAWIKRSFASQDGTRSTCMFAMLETEVIDGACWVPTNNAGFDGSIAFHDDIVYWAMSEGEDAKIEGRWVPADKRLSTTFGSSGIYQLRSHNYGTVGYVEGGRFVTEDVFGENAPTVAPFVYLQGADFGATRLVAKTLNLGKYAVEVTDKVGNLVRHLDSGYENNTTNSKVAISWGGEIAAWSVSDGLKVQRIDQNSAPQFIHGATEFVVEGTTLYYIGPDETGQPWLYGRGI